MKHIIFWFVSLRMTTSIAGCSSVNIHCRCPNSSKIIQTMGMNSVLFVVLLEIFFRFICMNWIDAKQLLVCCASIAFFSTFCI